MKTKAKKAYEKPVLKKEGKMQFPLAVINASDSGLACRQCSSCHGCR